MTQAKDYPVSKPVSRLVKTGVLDPGDVAAAIAIENAVVSILTHDIRATRHEVARPGARPGSGDEGFMRFFDCRLCYYDWFDAMQAAGLSTGPVLDVILEGKPLHRVDKAWRRRKGWTRDLVKRALNLYQTVNYVRESPTTQLTA